MADNNKEQPPQAPVQPQDIPTNFLLMKTRRSRVPWAIIIGVATVAAVAGAVLWYVVSFK